MNLTHEDYAVLGFYQSFNLLLAPLLSFSLFSFYSRNYYFVPEKEKDDLGNTVLMGSIIIGFLALFLFVFVFYLLYGNESNFPFFPFAILVFSQLYVANITSFHLMQLRITRKAKSYAKVSLTQFFIVNALALFFVVGCNLGAEGKLIGTLIATIFIAIYSLHSLKVRLIVNWSILMQGLKFGLPLTVSALLWYVVSGVDRLFLSSVDDKTTYGLYCIGLQIASYMGVFYTTITNTFEPDIYQSIAKNQKKKLIIVITIIIGFVSFFNLLFIFLAPYVIDLLTAGRYVDAVSFSRIFALHNISMAIYYMIVKLLIGYGMVKAELLARVLGACISVVLYYLLIKYYTFYGAAYGTVFSFVILSLCASSFLLVKRQNLNRKSMCS